MTAAPDHEQTERLAMSAPFSAWVAYADSLAAQLAEARREIELWKQRYERAANAVDVLAAHPPTEQSEAVEEQE